MQVSRPRAGVVQLKRWLSIPEMGVIGILLALSLILTLTTTTFLTSENLFSVARAFSWIAIMAIGECLVIITGGIDLSVASVFGLAGAVAAWVMVKAGAGVLPGVLAGLAVGLVCGLGNGLLITKTKLPPFIATIGMLNVGRGLAYALTGGWPISGLPASFLAIGQGHLWVIPIPVIIMVVLASIFAVLLVRATVSRHIFAVGGNEQAAILSGISADRVKLLVYSLSGILAAVGGMIMTSRLGVAQSTAGLGYEMDVVAAAVIGGTSFSGGEGSIVGTVLGAAIMGVLRNGLVLLNVSAYWQQVTIGLVIVLAIMADQLRKR
ncbi:MAG: ABC transporter permease [Chitinophagales bacterium]